MAENHHIAIAIDGPAASGKSTIARELAKRLNLVMINSGEIYRAVTWKILSLGINPADLAAVENALLKMNLFCGKDGLFSTISIDDSQLEDKELRSKKVNRAVSTVSANPAVRNSIVELLRSYLKTDNVVMEGRDIGSVVFPDTPYKIYVDASEEVRAARRAVNGEKDSVVARDKADSERSTAPLVVAQGAVIFDNSNHTIESAITAVMKILEIQGFSKLN
jgi:CMP/dCMP kinase